MTTVAALLCQSSHVRKTTQMPNDTTTLVSVASSVQGCQPVHSGLPQRTHGRVDYSLELRTHWHTPSSGRDRDHNRDGFDHQPPADTQQFTDKQQ